MPIPPHVQARRAALSAIAKETKDVLPGILKQLPHLDATMSYEEDLRETKPLDPAECPGFTLASDRGTYGTLVKVLNEDSLDAAIMMGESLSQQTRASTTAPGLPSRPRNQRVAVLNLASDKQPGGGWLTGAVAQEEAICYRSSLALSLHKQYYPWAPLTGLYTRDVVVIRSSMGSGHRLLLPRGTQASSSAPSATTPASSPSATTSTTTPSDLPVLSVISIAGIRRPELRKVYYGGLGSTMKEKHMFKKQSDRQLTKDKMRLCLRIAANEGHELLVLGAIGCGAFHNPPGEIADCWAEVLEDAEFQGGWFREIWFAVFDRKNEGNFEVFDKALGGKEVGKVAKT
ncbi:uncharacterized protein B0I36DRAFT_328163 [Microdochium trichocladiopsis]|uniref:Microbial-type PARG catalytic domain-containing protein n=1 Tax=Microdochium trichocladiopsis TaxID=1682393 RepID=A0A9P9BNM7_9PEZI|nr:uncharacterized protein B0I36DRAFT_328163 [Microdochium trichocladiopsis]KAH7027896.1 hypothetical protein B0I36DRAFT_328163 [Microdochium trichocladiopsis]